MAILFLTPSPRTPQVYVNGKLAFSKLAAGNFPTPEQVAARTRPSAEKSLQPPRQRLATVDRTGAVRLWQLADGRLLVNEIAPRVHNTGHWTQDGCAVDQFEQHIRAVAGWPLGSTTRHSDVTMENLIGDDVERWQQHLVNPAASLRLYGKSSVRPGRKMGHVNLVARRSPT